MLGIGAWILQEIAEMPTQHSWAAKIMSLDSDTMDKEAEKVDLWIQKTIEAEYPQTHQAERMVRLMWPAVMEYEAIKMFLEEHPYYITMVPLVDPEDAVYYATSEVMDVTEEDKRIAEQFLTEMLEGMRVPPHIKNSDFIEDIKKSLPIEGMRPHIPNTAQAGSLVGISESLMRSDCEMHPVIPCFPDYMATIPIHGDSMDPDFHNGDILAITKVDSFIQWGKTYVLDTRDGVVIKKLYEDNNGMRCVSYNKEYPDFVVSNQDIVGIWRIVGMLRLI